MGAPILPIRPRTLEPAHSCTMILETWRWHTEAVQFTAVLRTIADGLETEPFPSLRDRFPPPCLRIPKLLFSVCSSPSLRLAGVGIQIRHDLLVLLHVPGNNLVLARRK